MKKRIIAVIIVGGLIVILILAYIGLQQKTDWTESVDSYGEFNPEREEGITTENYGNGYDVYTVKDIRVTSNILTQGGEVTLDIYLNDNLEAERTYNAGKTEEIIVEVPDFKGTISTNLIAESDVTGTYSVKIYTRETRFHKILRRLQDK